MKVVFVGRVKHGDLYEALQRRNWTQKQGAKFLGMDKGAFGNMINLKALPKFTLELDIKLFELTGKTSEELFPEEFRTKEFLEGRRVFTALGNCGAKELVKSGIQSLPQRPFEKAFEQQKQLARVLEKLTFREQEVIRLTVIENLSVEKAAEELKVTPKRVSEILLRAKKKLREIGLQIRENLENSSSPWYQFLPLD